MDLVGIPERTLLKAQVMSERKRVRHNGALAVSCGIPLGRELAGTTAYPTR